MDPKFFQLFWDFVQDRFVCDPPEFVDFFRVI